MVPNGFGLYKALIEKSLEKNGWGAHTGLNTTFLFGIKHFCVYLTKMSSIFTFVPFFAVLYKPFKSNELMAVHVLA